IPLTQAVIVICIVALTGVLISALLALRRTAVRAEAVLSQLEREIHPMASQLQSPTGGLRTPSHHPTPGPGRGGGAGRRPGGRDDEGGATARRPGESHPGGSARGRGDWSEEGARGLHQAASRLGRRSDELRAWQ